MLSLESMIMTMPRVISIRSWRSSPRRQMMSPGMMQYSFTVAPAVFELHCFGERNSRVRRQRQTVQILSRSQPKQLLRKES